MVAGAFFCASEGDAKGRHETHRLTGDLGSSRQRGRRDRLRLSGRRDHACLRRAPRVPHPARARATRAGRGAHGGRLRARFRQGWRRRRDLGTRRHQSRHRHRHGDDGLVAHRVHHRPGLLGRARHRRVPGDGHYRRHAADHQAQLPGHARRGHLLDAARGVPPGAIRSSRTGARRRYQGRAAGDVRFPPRRRSASALRPQGAAVAASRSRSRCRADRRERAAAGPLRPGHRPIRSERAARELRGEDGHARRIDAARAGRLPRFAPAQPRHDGDARRGVGEPRHPGRRSADRARHALRRPRHGKAQHVRSQRAQDPRRDRSLGDQQEREGRRGAHG